MQLNSLLLDYLYDICSIHNKIIARLILKYLLGYDILIVVFKGDNNYEKRIY